MDGLASDTTFNPLLGIGIYIMHHVLAVSGLLYVFHHVYSVYIHFDKVRLKLVSAIMDFTSYNLVFHRHVDGILKVTLLIYKTDKLVSLKQELMLVCMFCTTSCWMQV